MNITYEVPEHLVGYLSTIPEAKRSEFITKAIERSSAKATLNESESLTSDVVQIKQLLLDSNTKQSTELKYILQILYRLSEQVNEGVIVQEQPVKKKNIFDKVTEPVRDLLAEFSAKNTRSDDEEDDDIAALQDNFLADIIK